MKNIITRAAALFICAACLLAFTACTDGDTDQDRDGIYGEEGKSGTDNILGDGGVDDKANGNVTDAPNLGDITDDLGTTDGTNGGIIDGNGDVNDNGGTNGNGGMNGNGGVNGNGGDADSDNNGGVLDPDDDVNGGMNNGSDSGSANSGNSVDPELGIGTDGTRPGTSEQ